MNMEKPVEHSYTSHDIQAVSYTHLILNADLLVNVPNSDDEEYAQNFLVRRDGKIILEPYGWPEIPYRLQTELEGIGASDIAMENVETALKQGESEMMLIKGADNRALYVLSLIHIWMAFQKVFDFLGFGMFIKNIFVCDHSHSLFLSLSLDLFLK